MTYNFQYSNVQTVVVYKYVNTIYISFLMDIQYNIITLNSTNYNPRISVIQSY